MRTSIIHDSKINENKGGWLHEVDAVIKHGWKHIPKIVTEWASTPAVFRDKVRRNANFIEAHYCVIDFDSGYTPEEIIRDVGSELIAGYLFGSKNHMKDKGDGKGIIPRCHLYLPFDEPITCPKEFKSVVNRIIREMAWTEVVDHASNKAAQYWGKKSCLISKWGGSPLPIKTIIESEKERERIEFENMKKALLKQRRKLAKEGITDPVQMVKRTSKWGDLKIKLKTPGERHGAVCSVTGIAKVIGCDLLQTKELILSEWEGSDWNHHEKTIEDLFRNTLDTGNNLI